MQTHSSHVPDDRRHLPFDLYGHFDIRSTPDGGRQYSLPHTLGASVLAFSTKSRVLSGVLVAAVIWTIAVPEQNASSPLALHWIYVPLMFALLHLLLTIVVAAAALLTGLRKITRITIRQDGLILNDASFYAAGDVWMIGYGVTSNAGKADEVFVPKITVQVGVNVLTLADGLEAQPAKLFMRLFQDDTRRYWHRHN